MEPDTKYLSQFSDENDSLVLDSQEVMYIAAQAGIPEQYREQLTGVVFNSEWEYSQCYFTESGAPYWNGALYHNVAYYTA